MTVAVIKIYSCTVNNGHWINDGVIVYLTFYDAYTVIKSPRYTGGDFMFLYQFVRRRRRRLQSCSRYNFCTTFQISFIYGRIHEPDQKITWLDLSQFSSWPWPWIFKVKYQICCISQKNGPIARKQKNNKTYRLNSLSLNFLAKPRIFKVKYGIRYISLGQKWSNCHETKSKDIDWTLGLKCDHRIWHWPWPWLWTFKVKFGICYILVKNYLIATKWKLHL